jgi:uncharacterized membrane protein YhhN
MTDALLVVAGLAAVADWFALDRRLFRLEYVFKPLTLVLLIAAAASADLGPAKAWVVAALVLGLLGDVGLMLSKDGTDPDPAFLAGLGAFALGHVCYLIAFVRVGVRGLDVLAGALIVVGIAALSLPKVLRGAAAAAGRGFAYLVAGYAALLAAMAILGVGTGLVATAIGGVLFLASDTLIARERFVTAVPRGRLLVIVSYHLAQFLILLGVLVHY